MVAVYGPIKRIIEKRERFWNDLNRIVNIVGNEKRLHVLYLSGWVGDRLRVGITGRFAVPREMIIVGR